MTATLATARWTCARCGLSTNLDAGDFPFRCPRCAAVHQAATDRQPTGGTKPLPIRVLARPLPATPDELLTALEFPVAAQVELHAALEEAAAAQGVLVGDLIAGFTKRLGWPPCGGCDARRQWLNRKQLAFHAWLASFGGG